MSSIYGDAIYETSVLGENTTDSTTGNKRGNAWYEENSMGLEYWGVIMTRRKFCSN